MSCGGLSAMAVRSLELLYNLYEARILGYQENPPPQHWNGAFALLTK
jgi:adenylate cyclase